MMSKAWPSDVALAIAAAQTRADQRRERGPRFSMPAAETFGPAALARAVHSIQPVAAAIAVTDCMPAARAITAGGSTSPVMSSLIQWAREGVEQWLGVHVLRELNSDADTLSHPDRAAEVAAKAEAARLVVEWVDVDWGPLRAALAAEAEGWEW